MRRLGNDDEQRLTRRLLAGGTLLVSLVVLGFYLTNKTVNYGGWTTGLRWLMWLSPLWLCVCVCPWSCTCACPWSWSHVP